MNPQPVEQYNIVNGTYYHKDTPRAVIGALERARINGKRIRVFYGDTETGRDWMEEWDTKGRIKRSTGSVQIPILVNNSRSLAGPALNDHCIVRMVDLTARKELYRHPSYFQPVLTIKHKDGSNYPYVFGVYADNSNIANFTTYERAERWIEFMKGNRHSK